MNLKISSKEFYHRQEQEIKRFLNADKKSLHICMNPQSIGDIKGLYDLDTLLSNNEIDIVNQIKKVEKNYYDFVVITDLFEISDDIYELLLTLKSKLTPTGKILVSTVNPKWSFIIRVFELLKLKNYIKKNSKTNSKKIISMARSCGLEFNYFYTKQIFPFSLGGVGRILNKLFELILFKFNFGIKNYLLFSNIFNKKKVLTKSVIVPAKNESENLKLLFENFPNISNLSEVVLICADSIDDTINVGYKMKKKYKDLNIKIIEQTSKGKAGAVFEGMDHTTGELIAILDSDISVEPKTLNSFFEIIENGNGDFVNGTRLIYPIEDKSMRFINKLGNQFFKSAVSLVIQNKLSDSLCGTKVFRRSHIEKIKSWREELNNLDPFGDFDFLFSAAYSGEKIVEYPVHYKARVYGETQINRYRDGFKLIIYFFKSFSRFNSSIN
tara:strand:+ start:1683 stop:3002 length:1320 start_codon:yes stop_codon:yes gene_type:complete